MNQDVKEQVYDVYYDMLQAQLQVTREIMQEAGLIENKINQAIENSHGFFDYMVDRLKQETHLFDDVPCKEGCSYCCSIPVESFLEEIKYITHQEKPLVSEDGKCPLLVEGKCFVYAKRPLLCRAWHSTSLSHCISYGNGKAKGVSLPTLGITQAIGSGILEGLVKGIFEFTKEKIEVIKMWE